jgi:hypothetical protein
MGASEEGMQDDPAEINHQLIRESLDRITAGDKEAAFHLAQLYMTRVVKMDVEVMLSVIEGLARQSAALGSADAIRFLEDDWAKLRQVLHRRLTRTFRSDSG